MSTHIEHIRHDKEAKELIKKDVRKYGAHFGIFPATDYLPGFAYSIGFYKSYKHPEIIISGLKTEVMKSLLNHAHKLIKSREILELDKLYSGFLNGYDITFIKVDKAFYTDYFGYAGWYYKNSWDFNAIQLIWPDKQSKWPWDADFDEAWLLKQKLFDRDMDFKFFEKRNLGVYTTQHVIDGKPILYVYHNADGDWQFHSELEPDINDAKLVGNI